MLDKLVSATFTPYLNDRFTIVDPEGEALEVELISVTELRMDPGAEKGPKRIPFSLVFRSAEPESHLPQAIYAVKHPQVGSLDVFLVPLGPDEHGMRYEAVFN